MSVSNQIPGAAPKKSPSKFKLFLYCLALIGLVWVGISAYWGFFKLKLWMAGFGTGAFWAVGLITGFIYFHAAFKVQENIKAVPVPAKKIGAYLFFALGLLVLNPVSLSLALWLFTPPGSLNTVGEWFFMGSSLGGVIVSLMERLFRKKAPEMKP
jgi:hypothetical protein